MNIDLEVYSGDIVKEVNTFKSASANFLTSGLLYTLKSLRTFCLCGLYLLLFTILEIKIENILKYVFVNIRKTKTHHHLLI